MKDDMKTRRDRMREPQSVKAVKYPRDKAAEYAAPKIRVAKLPEIALPKPVSPPKSANMFYTARENVVQYPMILRPRI